MSLIIASNVNLNDSPDTSEIHRPYSWSNRLSNTMKIPANSEIALQSAKINKNGLLSIGKNNANYGLYIGQNIDDTLTLKNSTTHPCVDSVVREGIKEFTTDEFAKEIQLSMRNNVMNPSFYDKAEVAVEVTPNVNGVSGAFEGFEFDFIQNAKPVDSTPEDGEVVSVFPTSRFTYVAGEFKRVAAVAPETDGSAPRGACAIFPDFPVILGGNLNIPSLNYDISGGVGVDKGKWACGLSRYTLDNPMKSPTTNDVMLYCPPYYDPKFDGGFSPFGRCFFDFVAIRDQAGNLKLFQSCVNTNRISGDNLIMKEVVYYHAANPIFKSGIYDLSANGSLYTDLRWRLSGDSVICEIGKGGVYDILVNTTMGDKRHMFYPRSCLQNFLYPQIFIDKIATEIKIDLRNTYDALPDSFDPASPNVDWVARLTNTNKYVKWGNPVESRPHNDANSNLGNTAFVYKLAEPYNVGGTTGGWLAEQANLILAPNRDYGIEYTSACNAQFSFGFKGRSLAVGKFDGVDGDTELVSTNAPILFSPKSLFVRLNNFTQNSINAQLGNAYSKIIGHLPRFDSAGNEVGGLFFEPHELVYIKLNNPNDTYMNTIDIDLVYDNETYAECLSGKSIVVLHMRKSRD
mgnify:FL=1|tara:strand:- start:1237 stop:3123 length:1887 start_codon:yes stop_codon:yes gene_type:complete